MLCVFDPWKSPLCTCPPKYSLQPYTGCSHFCLYCYATSYVGRKPSTPKKRFIERLKRDLDQADLSLVIELSTSSDPYPPVEEGLMLTRRTLGVLMSRGARVLITTKSGLVARDTDILSRTCAAVMLTITTLDEGLARKLEPGAPPPSKRIEALRILSRARVPVGVRVDPVIPGLNSDPAALEELIARAHEAGAQHVVTSTYKAKPDNFRRMIEAFPDMEGVWRRMYLEKGELIHGYRYLPKSERIKILKPVVEAARKHGMTYATCREGLKSKEFFNAPSCDGSHLIDRS